jgi:hypothetical protein
MKIPMTSSGIETATCRSEPQCLNRLRFRVSLLYTVGNINEATKINMLYLSQNNHRESRRELKYKYRLALEKKKDKYD